MTNSNDRWEPCPSGQLSQMVQAGRARKRRQTLDRAAVFSAVLLVGVVVVGFVAANAGLGSAGEQTMTCAQVAEVLPNYANKSLDAKTTSRVDQHLKHCPQCQTALERMLTAESISKWFCQMSLLAMPRRMG